MIRFTERARTKIQELLKQRGRGVGIRIGTNTRGCSGLSYVLEYVDTYTAEEGVTNFAQPEFVVLVSFRDQVYLSGLEVDWVKKGLNEGFEFTNPNETARCGCGESFKVWDSPLAKRPQTLVQ